VVGVGAVLGLGGSVVLGSALGSFLIGLGGIDPAALLAAPVVLAAVAAAAAWLPARRVGRVDPTEALRSE